MFPQVRRLGTFALMVFTGKVPKIKKRKDPTNKYIPEIKTPKKSKKNNAASKFSQMKVYAFVKVVHGLKKKVAKLKRVRIETEKSHGKHHLINTK